MAVNSAWKRSKSSRPRPSAPPGTPTPSPHRSPWQFRRWCHSLRNTWRVWCFEGRVGEGKRPPRGNLRNMGFLHETSQEGRNPMCNTVVKLFGHSKDTGRRFMSTRRGLPPGYVTTRSGWTRYSASISRQVSPGEEEGFMKRLTVSILSVVVCQEQERRLHGKGGAPYPSAGWRRSSCRRSLSSGTRETESVGAQVWREVRRSDDVSCASHPA